MNQNWPKWIYASVDKCIRTALAADSLAIYNDFQQQPQPQVSPRLEFAINGPDISEPGASTTYLYIQLVVLVSNIRSETDWLSTPKLQGLGQKAMPGCIPVYKFGTGGDDTQAQLGILIRDDRVKTLSLGHQDKSNVLRQIGLMANYRMDL